MNNTLVTMFYNANYGLRAKVWLTVNGKWRVSYHDLDSGEQFGVFTDHPSNAAANLAAKQFVNSSLKASF